MKVAHLITGLGAGGAETMLAKLMERMDHGRFEQTVIAMLPGGERRERIEAAGVPVYDLGMHRGLPTPGALAKLIGVLRRFKPDILQTWLYHADLLGLLAAQFAGRPTVVWNIRCSDMHLENYSPVTAWTLKACARLSGRPAAVLSNSAAAMAYHRKLGYRPRLVRVIPNGFDLQRFHPDAQAGSAMRQQFGLSEKDIVAGLAARFDPMKDHACFFRAAGRIASADPRVRFLLCGADINEDNAELVRAAEESGVRDRTRLVGPVEDMPAFMNALDVFALTSAYGEGFPNVLGEAMACGVPCVTTAVGDAADIVGQTGRTAGPGDDSAVAQGVLEILGLSESDRKRLGGQCRERVARDFSLEAVVEAYKSLYKELLCRNAQPPLPDCA